jgi:hypothetical protein
MIGGRAARGLAVLGRRVAAWGSRLAASARRVAVSGLRLGHDERGTSLPEVLVGVLIAAIVLNGTLSIVFSTNKVQQAAGGRSKVAAELGRLSLWFDRDSARATKNAPASWLLAGHTQEDCGTRAMDLGFLEGGSGVSYSLVAASGATDGPYRLQRASGSGTIIVLRYATSCSWAPEGNLLRLSVCFEPPGVTVECVHLRGAPRTW